LDLLPLDLSFECGGIAPLRIAGCGLLNEHPVLSALFRSGAQTVGAFGQVGDHMPLRVAADPSEFLPDELFEEQEYVALGEMECTIQVGRAGGRVR
jgi:hypothetical protein